MNPTDIQALNDAIKDLTKQLKDGGSPTTPGAQPTRQARDTSEQTAFKFLDEKLKKYDEEIEKLEEIKDIQLLTENQKLELMTELEEKKSLAAGDRTKFNEQEEEILRVLKLQGNEQKKAFKTATKLQKIEIEKKDAAGELLEIEKKLNEQRKEALKMGEGMVHSLGAMIGMSAPKKGGIVDTIGALTSKDGKTRKNALKGIGSGLKTMFSPLNIATNLFQKLGELFIYALTQGDKAAATFAKLTGHGRDLAGASMSAASALGPVNANLQEMAEGAAKAQVALAGIAGRTRLQAAEFGGLSINLERLGVSMADFTTIASRDMVAFGATNEEVAQKMANMRAQADALGMSFGEFSSMAASSQSSFAAFGSNSEKAFLRAASTARQLGIELGKVVDLGEKFDTFESATETVADLNYIMGGPFLDSMELMQLQATEGPEAVAKKIREQFQATGKDFNDLAYHQRKALAQSMNMTVDDVEKMMTGPISDASTDAVVKATKPVDDLMARANSTLDIMEQFQRFMNQMAIKIANGIFGSKIQEGANMLTETMQYLSSKTVVDGIVSIGKGLMVIGKGAMFIISGIGKVFSDTSNTFGPIAQLIGAVVGKLSTMFMGFATITSKMGIFMKGLMKFLGPIVGLLEMGKDFAQSMGFFANDKEQAEASVRLKGGLAGAAAGGLAGSIIPGLGTLFGASAGYSLGAAGAEAMAGFAKGGVVQKGGAAIVGEKGPEVVVLPTGAGVIPNGAFAQQGAPFPSGTSPSAKDITVHVKLGFNERKFKELVTVDVVDVITGTPSIFA